ncbi:MAG: DNA repair exonuclease [Actinomycetia bacterium]|nr:DNA repair exonuclease [Actinomycetes bacterium]
MKILHTADIHLREYEDDRWKTLQKLIEIGKKKKVDIFVISGDLFDKDTNAENLRIKIRSMFSSNGFKIVIIPGNHDCNSYKSGMYFGGDTAILSDLSTPFEFKDIRIWGMPFETIEGKNILIKLHSLANKLTPNKKNILLYHGELLDAIFSRGDFGDEGEERYMPVKLSYFKDLNIDYVLAGHFHSKFDMWTLENGGYFVYPGSPMSITKREKGKRKVNIFEVGKPPEEHLLDTPYFEEVVIEFDPYENKKPLEMVKTMMNKIQPESRVILIIKGYINGKEIKISESEMVSQIKEIINEKCIEERYEFKDIQTILEDDLFKKFIGKLRESDYQEEKEKSIREIAIKSMMEAK